VNRVVSFVFDYYLDWPQGFISKVEQESFIFLDGSVDQLSDDVAQKSGICFAEFFYVELISVERLNLLIVFLSNNFAELMKENVLSLIDVVSLIFNEISNSNARSSLFGQVQQFASILEVNFP
jgi:hypothetical protein